MSQPEKTPDNAPLVADDNEGDPSVRLGSFPDPLGVVLILRSLSIRLGMTTRLSR